jgi:hypothetical protein
MQAAPVSVILVTDPTNTADHVYSMWGSWSGDDSDCCEGSHDWYPNARSKRSWVKVHRLTGDVHVPYMLMFNYSVTSSPADEAVKKGSHLNYCHHARCSHESLKEGISTANLWAERPTIRTCHTHTIGIIIESFDGRRSAKCRGSHIQSARPPVVQGGLKITETS